MRPLVLASTSRYRRALLDAAGIRHEAAAPEFDEPHPSPLPPEQMVVEFARRKAESLARRYPAALIIGADQTAAIDGRALTKPGSVERAEEQLGLLSGRTHQLLTAVALHDATSGHTEHELVVHEMTMRPLSSAQIRAYVEVDQPLDCAGAYKIEARGVVLFELMAGADHSAIIGLPITALSRLCRRLGVDLLDP